MTMFTGGGVVGYYAHVAGRKPYDSVAVGVSVGYVRTVVIVGKSMPFSFHHDCNWVETNIVWKKGHAGMEVGPVVDAIREGGGPDSTLPVDGHPLPLVALWLAALLVNHIVVTFHDVKVLVKTIEGGTG